MKITGKTLRKIIATEFWTMFTSDGAFESMADELNEIAQKQEEIIPIKDLLEAEGQLRLF